MPGYRTLRPWTKSQASRPGVAETGEPVHVALGGAGRFNSTLLLQQLRIPLRSPDTVPARRPTPLVGGTDQSHSPRRRRAAPRRRPAAPNAPPPSRGHPYRSPTSHPKILCARPFRADSIPGRGWCKLSHHGRRPHCNSTPLRRTPHSCNMIHARYRTRTQARRL